MVATFANTNDQFSSMMGGISSLLQQAEEDKANMAIQVASTNAALGLDSSDPHSNIMFLGQHLAEETKKIADLGQQYAADNSGANGLWAMATAPGIRNEAAIRAQNATVLQTALIGNQNLALNQAKIVANESPDNSKIISLYERQAQLVTARSAAEANIAQKQAALAQAGLFTQQKLAISGQLADVKANKVADEAARIATLRAAATKVGINPEIITAETLKDQKKFTSAVGGVEVASAINSVASSVTGQLANNPIDALAALRALPFPANPDQAMQRQKDIEKLSSVVRILENSVSAATVETQIKLDKGMDSKTPLSTIPQKELSSLREETKARLVRNKLLSDATSGLGSSINKLSMEQLSANSGSLIAGDNQLEKYFAGVPALVKNNKFADDTLIIKNFLSQSTKDGLQEKEQVSILANYYSRAKAITDTTIDKNFYGIPIVNSYNAIVDGKNRDLLNKASDLVLVVSKLKGQLEAEDKVSKLLANAHLAYPLGALQ